MPPTISARRGPSRDGRAPARSSDPGSRSIARLSPPAKYEVADRTPFLAGYMPVATAAQTGSGCVGPDRREIERRTAVEQPAEVREPPFRGAGPDELERRTVEQQDDHMRHRRVGRCRRDRHAMRDQARLASTPSGGNRQRERARQSRSRAAWHRPGCRAARTSSAQPRCRAARPLTPSSRPHRR